MTYSINIGGHLDEPDAEAEAIESAKEFVGSLDGVTMATFSGMHTGSTNLLASPDDEPDNETPEEDLGDEHKMGLTGPEQPPQTGKEKLPPPAP